MRNIKSQIQIINWHKRHGLSRTALAKPADFIFGKMHPFKVLVEVISMRISFSCWPKLCFKFVDEILPCHAVAQCLNALINIKSQLQIPIFCHFNLPFFTQPPYQKFLLPKLSPRIGFCLRFRFWSLRTVAAAKTNRMAIAPGGGGGFIKMKPSRRSQMHMPTYPMTAMRAIKKWAYRLLSKFDDFPACTFSQNHFACCHLITSLSYLPLKECCSMNLKLTLPISKPFIGPHLLSWCRSCRHVAAAIAVMVRPRLLVGN